MPGRKGRAAFGAARNRASSSGSWKKTRGDALRVCVTRSASNAVGEISRWVTDASWVGGATRTRARPAPARTPPAPRAAARAASAASVASCARLRLRSSSSGADEVSSARKRCASKRTRGSVPEQAGAQRGAEHEPSARDAVAAVVHLRSARRFGARGRVALCAPRRASPSSRRKSREARSRGFPDRRPHRGFESLFAPDSNAGRGDGGGLLRGAGGAPSSRCARLSSDAAAMRRELRRPRSAAACRISEAARACSAMSRAGRCAPAWRFFAVSQLRGAFRAEDSRNTSSDGRRDASESRSSHRRARAERPPWRTRQLQGRIWPSSRFLTAERRVS